MKLYGLVITLQDPLYYASRELGRFYDTGPYLHNYALSYALGLARSSYHDPVHVPHYQQDLLPLNQKGVYVTPAAAREYQLVTHTYKWADLRYQVAMKPKNENLPTYGQIREVAPESSFTAFVFGSLRIPAWIRLGKWFGKAYVEASELEYTLREGEYIASHPLNPLDLPTRPKFFDLITMPPVGLVENARLAGPYLAFKYQGEDYCLPQGMSYRFAG